MSICEVTLWSLVSTAWNVLLDCDETFNYWEPLHYLTYGYGLKPWEYDSKYALRPYAFLYILWIPCLVMKWMRVPKWAVFYACKFILAFVNLYSLSLLSPLYNAAPGIIAQASAFLPNSLACTLGAWILRFWRMQKPNKMLFVMAFMTIVTWPYSIVFYAAFALFMQSKFSFQLYRYMIAGLFAIVYIVFPVMMIDNFHYNKWTLSWLNAILYNIIGGNDGRFGVEGPYFYVLNGLLNYNLIFLSSLLPLDFNLERVLSILSFALLSSRPHKEERFLYPLIPLMLTTSGKKLMRFFHPLMILFTVWRLYSVFLFYGAPQKIFLSARLSKTDVLCMKDQWYRFPSHFLLSDGARIGFTDDMQFSGALPQYYHDRFAIYNDQNKASPTQYTDTKECTLYFGLRQEYPQLKALSCRRLLIANKTKAPYRWLYFFTDEKNYVWDDLCLFEKTSDAS